MANRLVEQNFTFVRDNVPRHTSSICTDCLKEFRLIVASGQLGLSGLSESWSHINFIEATLWIYLYTNLSFFNAADNWDNRLKLKRGFRVHQPNDIASFKLRQHRKLGFSPPWLAANRPSKGREQQCPGISVFRSS